MKLYSILFLATTLCSALTFAQSLKSDLSLNLTGSSASPAQSSEGQVCLYSEPNHRGYVICRFVGQSEYNLDNFGLNDRITSIRVLGNAMVSVFEHPNFGGARLDITRDVYDLRGSSWSAVISSFSVNRYGQEPPPYEPPQPSGQVCFFEDQNFRGPSFCAYRGQRFYNLSDNGGYWNDKISSIRFYGYGRVTVYTNSNFNGLSTQFTSDVYNLSSSIWFNDKISSIVVD